jgi:hypothetical protein
MPGIAHFTVELTSRFSPVVVTFDDIPSPSPKEARCAAMHMVVNADQWFISACRLTNEIRLTKAVVL